MLFFKEPRKKLKNMVWNIISPWNNVGKLTRKQEMFISSTKKKSSEMSSLEFVKTLYEIGAFTPFVVKQNQRGSHKTRVPLWLCKSCYLLRILSSKLFESNFCEDIQSYPTVFGKSEKPWKNWSTFLKITNLTLILLYDHHYIELI